MRQDLEPKMVNLILDNVADGVFTVDPHFKITFFNAAAEQITGFSHDEAVGRPCFEVFRTPLCGQDCPLRHTLHTGEKVKSFEVDILTSTRKRQSVSVSTAPLLDGEGNFVGGVETFRDLSPIEDLRRAMRHQFTFDDIVAKSATMRQIVASLPNVARSNATVLVEGSAGTGKELIANAIHGASRRRDGPFVKVSCGVLPSAILESELFGSDDAQSGRLRAATHGTLFLDDVADIPLPLQAKLFGALEPADDEGVRVIAATKHDLSQRVQAGSFREDLYYRLNVVVLHLPNLAERREDMPLLVDFFIDRLNLRMGRNLQGLTHGAMSMLLQHPFPGNVRELENALEHAYIVAAGSRIGPDDLPAHVRDGAPPSPGTPPRSERQLIQSALERHMWSVPRAAAALGMHRTTLWRKMKRLGLERPA